MLVMSTGHSVSQASEYAGEAGDSAGKASGCAGYFYSWFGPVKVPKMMKI
jgi:hypothetical protein